MTTSRRIKRLLADLYCTIRRQERGAVIVEFAFIVPILLILIMWGMEVANYAIARQKTSELAMQIADNASRMSGMIANLPITEAMINDVFTGAKLQSGDPDFENNARIILSSERPNLIGGQWINIQRCYGKKVHPSSWGKEGDGALDLSYPGIGPDKMKAPDKPTPLAIMFVELAVNYKPLISSAWAPSTEIVDHEGFLIRDNRNIDLIVNPDLVPVSTC